jgi:hypothetical protein
MSNYTPLTNFGAKDTLPSGNAAKVVRGSEFTIEFNNIASSIATKAEVNAPSFTSDATFGGNIVVNGTVDGRDVATDGGKLDLIEASATADQTDAEIKTAYENNSNTNAFTDADQSKLNAIEASADVTDTANVTTAGAAMLTGASFTGNVSTTGTLATGGFTLPASDGTVGQALLTDGSGAVAWGDVTVDITGKADLSGAIFTGDVRIGTPPSGTESLTVAGSSALYGGIIGGLSVAGGLSVTAGLGIANSIECTSPIKVNDNLYLSGSANQGGSGFIGIGTISPQTQIDIEETFANANIRLKVPQNKSGNILFYSTTESENLASIEGDISSTGIGSLDINVFDANLVNSTTPVNTFSVQKSYTYSEEPFTNAENYLDVSGHFSYFASGTNFFPPSAFSVKNEHSAAVGSSYADVVVMELRDSGNVFKGGLVTDEYHKMSLYDATSGCSARIDGNSFRPANKTTVTIGQNTAYDRLTAGYSGNVDLGTSSARWRHAYLANQPNVSSDQRLKQNIEDADDAGSTIDAIQVRKFDWIEGGKHQSYGMIAQELAEVYPEAVSVSENDEDTLGIATGDLIPMLIKEVQSLRSRVAELENV